MNRVARSLTVLTLATSVLAVARPAHAQRQEPAPGELEGVGITEKLDSQVPLDLTFRDERGEPVRLGSYFREGRPVILTLGYYRCPMLCNLVLDGLTNGLKELPWTAGGKFDIVTVSIDPTETATLAKVKKQTYLTEYGRSEAETGWHFLTGDRDSIRELADSVGFAYRYVESRGEYAHSAAIFVLTPDGKISRYLYGIVFEPTTLKLSLLEASAGKIGTIADRVVLYCFHYDADEGRYAPVARNIMKLGGALTVVVLGIALAIFWRLESRRRREGPTLEGSRT